VRLEPLYRCTFTPTDSWDVELKGIDGTEGQGFLLVEGRSEGRIAGRLRAANYPRHRVDGTVTPNFRGVLETDDGATVLFSWRGYARASASGPRQLLGSITHQSGDERYRWLNSAMCVLTGEIRPGAEGGFDVVIGVAELIWEPLGDVAVAAPQAVEGRTDVSAVGGGDGGR
jgi:hypothetical protein